MTSLPYKNEKLRIRRSISDSILELNRSSHRRESAKQTTILTPCDHDNDNNLRRSQTDNEVSFHNLIAIIILLSFFSLWLPLTSKRLPETLEFSSLYELSQSSRFTEPFIWGQIVLISHFAIELIYEVYHQLTQQSKHILFRSKLNRIHTIIRCIMALEITIPPVYILFFLEQSFPPPNRAVLWISYFLLFSNLGFFCLVLMCSYLQPNLISQITVAFASIAYATSNFVMVFTPPSESYSPQIAPYVQSSICLILLSIIPIYYGFFGRFIWIFRNRSFFRPQGNYLMITPDEIMFLVCFSCWMLYGNLCHRVVFLGNKVNILFGQWGKVDYNCFAQWVVLSFVMQGGIASLGFLRARSAIDVVNQSNIETVGLLQKLLPNQVASELLSRGYHEPEQYEMCGIFFSDIEGFTTIASTVTPAQVFDLLNQLYHVMDHVCNSFGLYKVETIGDAYMVCSGLKQDSESAASESRRGFQSDGLSTKLANFAIAVSKAVATVKNPADGSPIRIRIGLHCGPIIAGIVGKLMPRYCLFGDTVNTASRMESTGEAGRIHCSSDFIALLAKEQNALDLFCPMKVCHDNGHDTSMNQHSLKCPVNVGPFGVETRGFIQVKGKGVLETFWLLPVVHDKELLSIVHSYT